jgi:hypothetical protein
MSQTIAPVLGEVTVQELRRRSAVLCSLRATRLRRGMPGLERHARRQTAEAERPLPRGGRRDRGVGFARAKDLFVGGPRRRSERCGLLDLRRRSRHRPVGDQPRSGRPGGTARIRRRRRRLDRRRPRDPGARIGHHRRPDLDHRRRLRPASCGESRARCAGPVQAGGRLRLRGREPLDGKRQRQPKGSWYASSTSGHCVWRPAGSCGRSGRRKKRLEAVVARRVSGRVSGRFGPPRTHICVASARPGVCLDSTTCKRSAWLGYARPGTGSPRAWAVSAWVR